MIINDLDDYYIVFDTKNRNTELDTLYTNISYSVCFSINTIISLFSRNNSVQYVCIALVF